MRELADRERIRRFMQALGMAAEVATRVYFAGGASAVLFGWRPSTIDVDIKVEPDTDALFRAIPRIKESLHLNVELASPVPVRPGWQDRSPFIASDRRNVRAQGNAYTLSVSVATTATYCLPFGP